MTYWEYHFIFTLPLLGVLLLLTLWQTRNQPLAGSYRPENRWALAFFFLLPVIALVYTMGQLSDLQRGVAVPCRAGQCRDRIRPH